MARNRKFRYNPSVAKWIDIVDAINDTPLPNWVIMSLIHVESNGKQHAVRKSRKYWGLLQIGPKAARDIDPKLGAMYYYKRPRASIRGFLTLLKRYEATHQWDPVWVAILWKGGVGTLKNYIKRELRNDSDEELTAYLKKKWNTDLYVEWFLSASKIWKQETCHE